MNKKKFVHLNSDGESWGIVSAEQLWANVYALKYNKPEIRLDRQLWSSLFTQAKAAAVEFGAISIGARLAIDYEPEMFRSILTENGLSKISDRVEYQCDVSQLPDDAESPVRWKTAKELNWDTMTIAQFTANVIQNAWDIDPDEKLEDFIQDWIHHEELSSGPDCIAIGYINKNPCSLVVAQVSKSTGWSRLSYMGIVPEFRGKGFGKWVHRHGFKMMKDQGGKVYHGGTNGKNVAMRRLFESHDCKMFSEMEEWSCNLKVSPQMKKPDTSISEAVSKSRTRLKLSIENPLCTDSVQKDFQNYQVLLDF